VTIVNDEGLISPKSFTAFQSKLKLDTLRVAVNDALVWSAVTNATDNNNGQLTTND